MLQELLIPLLANASEHCGYFFSNKDDAAENKMGFNVNGVKILSFSDGNPVMKIVPLWCVSFFPPNDAHLPLKKIPPQGLPDDPVVKIHLLMQGT